MKKQRKHGVRIKEYRRSETSEGISVTSMSLYAGDFPEENVVYDNDMDTRPSSGPLTTPGFMAKESMVSDISTDDNETMDGDSTDEDNAIYTLVRTAQQKWKEDPEDLAGKVDRDEYESELQALSEDTDQLVRILIARKYDMEKAVALFFEQVRFRARWHPRSIHPNEIPNALPSGAWRLCGYTREGIVVSNYKIGLWNPSDYGASGKNSTELDDAVQEYTKYVVYMMEKMIAKMPQSPVPQQFVVLFDLKGLSASFVFRRDVRLMIRKLIYVAQSQYPERLYKTLLVNAPFGFEAAWRLILPLLDEKTASKIHFSKVGDLPKEIDPSVLSEEYGGTHPAYPPFTV